MNNFLFNAEAVIYVDGASRGNPGKASYGFVIKDRKGEVLHEAGDCIGEATNNFAEYTALVKALQYALDSGIKTVEVRSDSQLLVRQLSGLYSVKSQNLLRLNSDARKLLNQFHWYELKHIPRVQNKEADRLANLALDRQESE